MKPRSTRCVRRGQPLAALVILLLGWTGARTALWASAAAEETNPPAQAASLTRPVERSAPVPVLAPAERNARAAVQAPQVVPAAPLPAPSLAPPPVSAPEPVTQAPSPAAEEQVPPRIAAGHVLLFAAGVSALPMPPEALAANPPSAPAPPVPYLPAARQQALRWSADGWLLWREGGNGFNLPGAGLPGASLPSGAYGSSQAGFVVRYRLFPDSALRPTLYLRASSGLYHPRGEEAAAGLEIRPLPRVPVSAMAEARVTRTMTGQEVRPAVALVTELPPARLPLGLRGEAYAQAGWVGGKDHTPFIDGQVRIDAPVAKAGKLELRIGAGAWGGAQRGAERIDVGPSASLDLPVGAGRTRLSADYRFRVAGDAAPGSGAAITFSAGF